MADVTVISREVLAQRFAAQLLTEPLATDAVRVVDQLLAVQAQDARASLLAIRARSTGLAAVDVNRCLTDDRSLVVDWLNRGTLHLVRSHDHGWLHLLTAPRLITTLTSRLARVGLTSDQVERGIGVVTTELERHGPRTRAQLRASLDSAGVPTAGQALIHTIGLAAARGNCVRGPVIDGERAFVLRSDWIGDADVPDKRTALGLLALRYLRGHAPATDRDLAYWSGVSLTEARTGLREAGAVLLDGSDNLLVLKQPTAEVERMPALRLLGMFDPMLHGWQSRSAVLQHHDNTHVVTSNGIFRATVLAGGRAVATWTLNGGRIDISALPGEDLDHLPDADLRAEMADVLRFLGTQG